MNNFPISVSQIATGMNEASSALAAAGNSFEESVALLTAGNVTMQNANKTATALRTISARIRNTATDLEELGETDFTSAKYDELVQAVTKYKVSLTDVNGEYRSTYDIMSDIAGQWKNLSSMEQAALATAVAGTRQQSVFYSMMQNWDTAAVKSIEKMGQSDNALTDAYSIYEDTISAALQRMHTAFDELQIDAMNSFVPLINFAIYAATKLINLADGITVINEKLPIFTTLLGAVALVFGGPFMQAFAGIPLLVTGVVTAIDKVREEYKRIHDDAVNAANDLAEYIDGYASQKDKLEGYIEQIKVLQEKIANEELTESELYETRQNLLNIKDQLISMYGEEAKQIDVLGQSAEETRKQLLELYETEGRDKATLFQSENSKEISKATKEIEKERYKSVSTDIFRLPGSSTKEIEALAERIGVNSFNENGVFGAEFDGTANEIYKKATAFYQGLLEISSKYPEDAGLSVIINSTKKVISGMHDIAEEYGDIYDANVLAEITLNSEYSKAYRDFLEAEYKYGEVINKEYGSAEERASAVKSAYEELSKSIYGSGGTGGILNLKIGEGERGVKSFFDDLSSSGKETIKNAQAEYEIAADFLRSISSKNGEEQSADIGLGVSDKDTKVLEEQNALLDERNELVEEYNKATNGNLDYSNRPHVTKQDIISAGWDKVDPEAVASLSDSDDITTWSHGRTIGHGELLYTIDITPILDDGTVLTPEEFDQYVYNLEESLVKGGTSNSILEADSQGLVIHISEGDYDEDYWSGFYSTIDEYKQSISDIDEQLAQIYSDAGIGSDNILTVVPNRVNVKVDKSNFDPDSVVSEVYKILKDYISEDGTINLTKILDGEQTLNDKLRMSGYSLSDVYNNEYSSPQYNSIMGDFYSSLTEEEKKYLELSGAAEKYNTSISNLISILRAYGFAYDTLKIPEHIEDTATATEELNTKSKSVFSGLSNIKSVFDSMSNDTPISIDDFESLTKLSDDFSAVLSSPEIDKNKIVDAYGDAIDGVIEEYEEIYKANEESLAGEGSEEEKKKWQEENNLISIYISLLKQAKKESQGVIASSFDAEMSKVASAQSSIESIITSLQNEEVIDPSNFDVLKELSPAFSEIIANLEDGYDGARQLVEAYIKEVDKSIIESGRLIEENESKIESLTDSSVDGWEEQVAALNEANTKLILQQKLLLDLKGDAIGYLRTFAENKYTKTKGSFSSLFGALNSQPYGGTISVDAYSELLEVMPEAASYIENENGLMELNYEYTMKLFDAKNAEAIAEINVAKALEKENYDAITKEIKRYNKESTDTEEVKKKQLETLRKEQKESQNTIAKYDLMINELVELSSAYKKWQEAQNMGSSGDMRDDMQKAVDQINEALNSGQTGVGNYKYQAALDLVVPEEFQTDAANVQKYITALGRYITENPGLGASNFWSDIISSGLAEETAPGSGIYNLVEGANIYDIGKALGKNIANGMTLTPDMVKAMFGALEMYDGFKFHWTQDDWNLAEAQYLVDTISENLEGVKVKFDAGEITQEEYNEIVGKYKELRDQVEQVLSGKLDTSEVTKTLNELDTMAKNAGVDIPISLESSEEEDTRSKLEAIADDLDTIAEKADALLSKNIGTLGANVAATAVKGVVQALRELDNTSASVDINYRVNTIYSTSYSSVAPDLTGVDTGGWRPGRWQGTAAANGNGEPRGGKTLVGELGREIWVSGDKFKTVGEDGAELIDMKRGDIIFNAEDTEKILKGKPGARGISMMNGSAMVSGGGPKIVVYNGTGNGIGSGSDSNSTVENDEDNWFEWEYNQHKHLVEMDREETEEFLNWLKDAWPKAYSEGIIEYTDALSYEEEVYNGLHDLFQDYLSDEEFKINKLKEENAGVQTLIDSYDRLSDETMVEIVRAKAAGLDENDDYVQALYNSYYTYINAIKDLQDSAFDTAKNNIDSLIKYRMKMIERDKKNQKDSLNEQLNDLKDFISKQKELLQDTRDEEEYLENQAELRKTVSDLEIQLNQLQYDNSAWASKRRLELQEELDKAKKELNDFENDYAFEKTVELLDDSYDAADKIVKDQVKSIEDWLENEENVYTQALIDVQNNNQQLYDEMRAFERYYGEGEDSPVVEMWEEAYKSLKSYIDLYGTAYKGIDLINATGYSGPITGYATGTSGASAGLHKLFENGDEYIFSSSDGNKYRMFSGGEKVLNANQTSFLYDFAKTGSAAFTNMFEKLSSVSIPNMIKNAASTINMGDIIIQGNADKSTVSEIRRQQRDSMNYMLKKLAVLQ